MPGCKLLGIMSFCLLLQHIKCVKIFPNATRLKHGCNRLDLQKYQFYLLIVASNLNMMSYIFFLFLLTYTVYRTVGYSS